MVQTLSPPHADADTATVLSLGDINAARFSVQLDDDLQTAVDLVANLGIGVDLEDRTIRFAEHGHHVPDARLAAVHGRMGMSSQPDVVVAFLNALKITVTRPAEPIPLSEHQPQSVAGGLRPDPQAIGDDHRRINPMFSGYVCSCGAQATTSGHLEGDSDWYQRHLGEMAASPILRMRQAAILARPNLGDEDRLRMEEIGLLLIDLRVEGVRPDFERSLPITETFDAIK